MCLDGVPECPRYQHKFLKGEPLGIIEECRSECTIGHLGVLKKRLLTLCRKWYQVQRNEWALDPERASGRTLAESAAWTEEKKDDIANWSVLRRAFTTELDKRKVFASAGDDDAEFLAFLERWESRMQPEVDNWPLALAFEKW